MKERPRGEREWTPLATMAMGWHASCRPMQSRLAQTAASCEDRPLVSSAGSPDTSSGYPGDLDGRVGVQRLTPHIDRQHLIPLMVLADDSLTRVEEYLNKGCVRVLKDKALAVGIALAENNQFGAELHNIAVALNYQRRGLGGRLLNQVIQDLHHAGVAQLRLATAFEDQDAVGFYLKCGFRPAGWNVIGL